MSEHVCHVACCLDTRNLCRALGESGGIEPVFLECWDDPENDHVAQLGTVTRKADKFSAEIIAWSRKEHDRGDAGDPLWRPKLAFVLGALTHRSIDRHMKPVFAFFKQAGDAARGFNECTIYCDVLMLRERFGGDGIFPPGLLDPASPGASPDLGLLAQTVMRRELIRMHTLKPDVDDIHNWFAHLIPAVQDFKIRLHEYESVMNSPDETKWKRFLTDTNFYSRETPLIAATQTLAAGGMMTTSEVEAALAATDVTSGRYARALAKAVDYVRAAGRMWRGGADLAATQKAFDVGVEERSMIYPEPGEPAPSDA
jgi:hypothetical protein